MSGATWTSLEVAKLAVAAATPVIVLIGGFWLNGRLKKVEHAQWSEQKIIERRITTYDQIALPLNQLYCFFCYVGSWKEMTPPEAIRIKRTLDQAVHVNSPWFRPEFLTAYYDLMNVLYSTFGPWGTDAKLKTLTDRRRQACRPNWNAAWDNCFAPPDQATEPAEVLRQHQRFIDYLREAIGSGGSPADLNARTAELARLGPVADRP
jgi:hypothetical protein